MSVTTTIPLSRGAPSLDIVDIEGLSEAAARAFENDPAGIAGYGTSIGYPPLRKLIAEWHGVAENRVLVTNGSLQADAFLFDELAKPGPTSSSSGRATTVPCSGYASAAR